LQVLGVFFATLCQNYVCGQ